MSVQDETGYPPSIIRMSLLLFSILTPALSAPGSKNSPGEQEPDDRVGDMLPVSQPAMIPRFGDHFAILVALAWDFACVLLPGGPVLGVADFLAVGFFVHRLDVLLGLGLRLRDRFGMDLRVHRSFLLLLGGVVCHFLTCRTVSCRSCGSLSILCLCVQDISDER